MKRMKKSDECTFYLSQGLFEHVSVWKANK